MIRPFLKNFTVEEIKTKKAKIKKIDIDFSGLVSKSDVYCLQFYSYEMVNEGDRGELVGADAAEEPTYEWVYHEVCESSGGSSNGSMNNNPLGDYNASDPTNGGYGETDSNQLCNNCTTEIITSPYDTYDVLVLSRLLSNVLELSITQRSWFELNRNGIVDNVYLFLFNNYFTHQAIDYASEAINFLMFNPEYNFNEYENWFSSDYPDLEPNAIEINPDQITYDAPIIQQSLPPFNTFLSKFPKKVDKDGNYLQMSSPDVYQLVGGSLYNSHLNQPDDYNNACSIRGSRGLLYSGINIPILRYNGTQRTQKGDDKKNYILDAVSFNKFVIDKFGEATHKLEGTDANNATKAANLLKGKNGIYVIINNSHPQAGYSGHVDAIVDGICIGGAYTNPTGGVKSIRIWELN